MASYFNNVVSGFQSIFEGMSISLASMFVRPVTVQYPDDDVSSDETLHKTYHAQLRGIPENYRGLLDVDLSICTACQLCMKACPIDVIAIDNAKCDKTKFPTPKGKDAVKSRTCTRFDINNGKCMFCGLCVIACPTGAIQHTGRFEMNTYGVDELVVRLISEAEKERAIKREKEIKAEDAEKKAKKEVEEAKKKAAEAEQNEVEDEKKEEKPGEKGASE